jgi:hypothetical protein
LLANGLFASDLSKRSPWDLIGQGFMIYLADYCKKDGCPLMSSTIAEYMSHACSFIKSLGLFYSTELFYDITSDIFKGLIKRDLIFYAPLRLREKLSISFRILQHLCTAADKMPNNIVASFAKAAMKFGWGHTLRPGDYADLDDDQNGHKISSDILFFIFDIEEEPICIDNWHKMPVDRKPSYIAILPDMSKSKQTGKAPMRACPRNPDPDGMCIVQDLFEFFSIEGNRPAPGGRIFSKFPAEFNLRKTLTALLKQVATELGLNPDQMHLHGFRAGCVEQCAGESASDQDALGDWNHSKSKLGGRAAYIRNTILWADRIARSLFNLSNSSTIAQLKWIHTTPPSIAIKDVIEQRGKRAKASSVRSEAKK